MTLPAEQRMRPNIGAPTGPVDNLFRHWFAGHLAAVGGASLLPLDPLPNGAELRPPPAPSVRHLPAPKRQRRAIPAALVQPPTDRENISFYDLGDVLEQLDNYWVWLKRLKKYYPVGYSLGARIGAIISPETGYMAINKTNRVPEDPEDWPSFMMTSWSGVEDTKDRTHAKLVVFVKTSKVGDAVRQGKVFYECVLFYTRKDLNRKERRRYDHPIRFPIGVGVDGSILPLKVSMTNLQSDIGVKHKCVGYPSMLNILYGENKDKGEIKVSSLREYVETIFFISVSQTLSSEEMFHITVRHEGLQARFSVAHYATARFFRDRDFMATVDGRQARIFHVVAPHSRRLANGRIIQIPQHYAGAQQFQWHGYDVKITVPGHHHERLSSFSVPTVDPRWIDKKEQENAVDSRKVAAALSDAIWHAPKISIHGSWYARKLGMKRVLQLLRGSA